MLIGQTALIRHLGGVPAYNTYGDRKRTICGEPRTVYSWEKFPLYPTAPPFAIGVVLRGTEAKVVPWPCGRQDLKIVNDGKEARELEFVFNTAEQYRTPDGRDHIDGFAYAGWDGERARFEVRLIP
jgi:hypothetical protein